MLGFAQVEGDLAKLVTKRVRPPQGSGLDLLRLPDDARDDGAGEHGAMVAAQTPTALTPSVLHPDKLLAPASPFDDLTLVFLRHRGCLFTREWMQELRNFVQTHNVSRVVVVHQGSVEEFDRTLRPLWPDAEAVSDPKAELYASWSVRRGLLNEYWLRETHPVWGEGC